MRSSVSAFEWAPSFMHDYRVKVLRLGICAFRGFDKFVLDPRQHVLLVGEPRAGRSDVVAALNRVLASGSTRAQLDPWDFHGRDLTRRIDIEVILGALTKELQQRFVSRLELWDEEKNELVLEVDDLDQEAPAKSAWVLRLSYRARWNPLTDAGEHWVDFPKFSDPDRDQWATLRRAEREALPFVSVTSGKPLAVRAEGEFRRMLDAADDPTGLMSALDDLAADVDGVTATLSSQPAVLQGLTRVLEPLRPLLRQEAPAEEVIQFSPEGGTVSGLLRSLQSMVNLDESGFLPLHRHGSTLAAQLSVSEALANLRVEDAVVAVDDFGEGLDAASAEFLAGLLRRRADQVWLSTRRPEAARSFESEEIIRLTREPRAAHQPTPSTSSAERLADRQLHRQLLPAMTARALLICEGPLDVLALTALVDRRFRRKGISPPAAIGARFVDADGITNIPRAAQLAKELGFRVVALLDDDKPGDETEDRLRRVEDCADAVVRLPPRFAIEQALVHGVDVEHLRSAMTSVRSALELPWPDPQTLQDDAVGAFLAGNLKARSGVHAAFVESLPNEVYPPVAIAFLETALALIDVKCDDPAGTTRQILT